jgi:site-specific recombinase XerD
MTDHFSSFEAELRRQGKSPRTISSYLSDLRHFATWFVQSNGEPFSPQTITILDVRSYKSHLQTVANFKPATINRRLAALTKYCRFAKSQGLISEDPTRDVQGVRQQKAARPKALDGIELRRLLREVHKSGNKRDIAIVEVLANTGLRVGELASLAVEDIELSERKGQVTVRSGKGAKYRQVPLNADARRALYAYLEARPMGTTERFFVGQRGNGLTPSAIWRMVKKYGQRAGLDISPHTLRHTFGTRLVRENGVDLVSVARMMGHEALETTALYTQPSEEDIAEAAERLTQG